ncbi:MAG: S8 family serine peptidase [Phycisphaeraceae bacterium]|nr:S8 family serine peptidase [Phycisphaeraceae bacterium]
MQQRLHRAVSAASLILIVAGTSAVLPANASDITSARPAAGAAARPAFAEVPGKMEFSGQVTVRPRQDLNADRSQAARARLDGMVLKHYPEVDEYIVRVPEMNGPRGVAENQIIADLMSTGDYQYVEPNWICYPASTPADPLFTSQWHHHMMESQAAWNLLIGSPSVVVAVTDTGILTTHADLTNRVPGFNAVDDLAEVDGGLMDDVNGHGTHVAGCAAPANDNGIGVAGPGWGLGVMMIRVSNAAGGGAFLDDITQGARWAIDNGAVSASSSYTGVQSSTVETSGAYIRSRGGLYLYAADNSNTNHSTWDHPNVLVVGASNQSDGKADFSSYGLGVDLFAPGVSILSTTRDGNYGFASGTSMATPVANGVVGMMFAANPSLSPDHLEYLLSRTCQDWGPAGEDELNGWGRINMRRAVEAALASASQSPPIVIDEVATLSVMGSTTIDVLANDLDPNMESIAIGSFQSTTSLGATITRSVGTGPGGRDQLTYTASAVAGHDSFEYAVVDPHGNASIGKVSVDVRDASGMRVPENPETTIPGVRTRYYVTNDVSILPPFDWIPSYTQDTLANINIPSTGGNFSTSGRADNVGAVYNAYLTVPTTGTYTLSTNSDDGSKLWVGHNLVVNNDGLHGMVTVSGNIGLQAGTHKIRAEFFERGGGAGMIVLISGPGISNQPIPPSMWTRLCPSDANQDGTVDIMDFLAFMDAFGDCDGQESPCRKFGVDADINADGEIDILDFLDFFSWFGTGC